MERYLKEPNVKEEKGMEGLDDLAHHLDFDASWIKHELLEEDFEPDNFKHELIIKSEPSDQVAERLGLVCAFNLLSICCRMTRTMTD